MKTCLFLLLLFLSAAAFAIQARVELSIQQDSKLWVGQKIVASLSVKTDAYTLTDLRVDTQSGDEVIIIKPQSAAFKSSEIINDVQWQIVVYEYIIYPMHAGDIRLNPFQVEFSASMGYGQPKQRFNLQTSPLSLQVSKPEGVSENDFVLTTNKLALDVTYTPAFTQGQDTLKVGDAFERKVTISAENVPDFLLQPVPEYAATGSNEQAPFKVYRSEPVLSETNSSDIATAKVIARRIETDTFVASFASTAVIPEIVMYWWDPQQQKLHQQRIPAKTLKIIPDPLSSVEHSVDELAGEPGAAEGTKNIYRALLILLAIIFSAGWWLPKVKQRLAIRKRHFEASEAGTFKGFENACNEGNVHNIYQNFYVWARLAMPEVSPLNFQHIGRYYPELKSSLKSLQSALMNHQGQFDAGLFKTRVTNTRQTILIRQTRSEYELIKSINPASYPGT